MQHWCTDLAQESYIEKEREKRYGKNEISRHYVALTDLTPCQAQPMKKKAQRSLVDLLGFCSINHRQVTSLIPIWNVLDQMKFPSVPDIEYMACLDQNNIASVCFLQLLSVKVYIITAFNKCA